MIERLSPNARKVALVVLTLLVGWFLWSVRSVLNPLILGYLLAFIIHPLVLRLERRGWKRRRAVNFIFFAFAVLFAVVGFGIYMQGHALARELSRDDGLNVKVRERMEQALDEYQDEIRWVLQFVPQSKLQHTAESAPVTNADGTPVPATTQGVTTEDLKRTLREWWDSWLAEDRGKQAASIGVGVTTFLWEKVVGNLLWFAALLILLPIYTYFLLFELERIHRFVTRYLPHRDRDRLVRIGGQIGEVLANFFRGRLLVCLAKGSFLALGLAIADVNFALLIGLGTGFLSLIPFVGSFIGFVMALLVGMLDHTVVSALVRVGIVFFAAEMLENYVLLPKILGDTLGLHPIIVIFSLMAGAASLGMFGLLVALPLTATLVILAREFLLPVLRDLADKDPGPPTELTA